MREVGIRELKAKTSEILRELCEKRESIAITNRGKVVARLVPANGSRERVWRNSEEAIARINKLAEEIGKYLPPGTSAVEAVREQRREL
jgi:prevent-host-death family protein